MSVTGFSGQCGILGPPRSTETARFGQYKGSKPIPILFLRATCYAVYTVIYPTPLSNYPGPYVTRQGVERLSSWQAVRALHLLVV